MRTETRIILLLLLVSPAVAELLSGSAPPVRFFHPVGLVLLVALYGGGTLLIREARARWQLGWPVVLLAVAYGVLEEGTMMQSFFSHTHADLKHLSRYGMAGGVQWPWTLMVTFYHATVSTLIPITIADLLWPAHRNKPVLGCRGLMLCALGVTMVTVLGMLGVWRQQQELADPYEPSAWLLLGSVGLVAMLIALAYRLRRSVIRLQEGVLLPPFVFGLAAFLAQALNAMIPNAMAQHAAPARIVVTAQLLLIGGTALFATFQLTHPRATPRHTVSLVLGSLALFILVTPIHELVPDANPDPAHGMLAVGILAFGLLLWWRQQVLRQAEGRSGPEGCADRMTS